MDRRPVTSTREGQQWERIAERTEEKVGQGAVGDFALIRDSIQQVQNYSLTSFFPGGGGVRGWYMALTSATSAASAANESRTQTGSREADCIVQ